MFKWIKNHLPSKRRLIQLYAALLYNANIKGFISGNIYTGNTKVLCVPGMNCYSCPGAIGACPLGSLQNALAKTDTKSIYYVLGIIALYGLIFGRTVCGFLCPVGLLQDLLYKIKSFKIQKSHITYLLSNLKYVILIGFAVLLPIIYGIKDIAVPAFCKYICPAGTFEGAIGLMSNPNNFDLMAALGPLFTWKFAVLVIIMVASVFIYRFFCRFLCPLGAIYSLFNKFNILGVKLEENKCISCGKCIQTCKLDIHKVGDRECINCGECINVCPTSAIHFAGSKIILHPNEVEVKEAVETPEITAEPKQNKKKIGGKTIATIVVSSLALASLTGCYIYYNVFDKEPVVDELYEIGEKVPDVEISLYGEGNSSYKFRQNENKITLINFWATYCGPCVQEIPMFEEKQNLYKTDLNVIAVHHSYIDQDVQAYINKKWSGYSMMFAQDTEELDILTKLGGTSALPYTVVLDRTNTIKYVHSGKMTEEALTNYITTLL